jgi:ABC-type transport system involved in cytochrome bd biosynthesis fused ATPase/permease subunit
MTAAPLPSAAAPAPADSAVPDVVPAGRHAPRGPLLRLLVLAGPQRGRLLAAVLAGAAATGCGVALLAVSGFLLARASQHPNIVAISVAVVAVRGLSVGRSVFRYLERLGTHDVAFRVLAQVRVAIYTRLERLAPAGLAAFRSGDLLARLISDVDAIQDLFTRGQGPGGRGQDGQHGAGVAVPWLTARSARRAAERTAPARGELGAAVTDSLAGAAELHAFGAVGAAIDRVQAADTELTRLARRTAGASGLGTGLTSAVSGVTLWAVLVLGVAATGQGALGRVPLAVITLTALAAFEAVLPLPAAAIQLGQARATGRRIAAVLDAPDPVTEPGCPAPLPAWPASGAGVELRGAQVAYRAGGPLALNGLDLDLPPGRRVALLGPTGAGKSTVAAVLLRFIDLAGGTATLNGCDLARLSGDEVRTVIRGLAQDAHMFDTTIRANLLIGAPEAGDGELADVLARVRLTDWIASLPEGWETQVGAHGASLSGGQRQRLALARALLSDPAVLVLDEPTAHLDPDNRASLAADLLAVSQGRSTLLITHDLLGLDQVDEIIVLSDGRVIERGSHTELSRASGPYHHMLRLAGCQAASSVSRGRARPGAGHAGPPRR